MFMIFFYKHLNVYELHGMETLARVWESENHALDKKELR